MTLPGFLVIGGMKCGSTTLFRDLELHPQIFFPPDKEPENLCHDRVLTPEGLAEYEELFKRCRPAQIAAEASTAYTKRPTFEGMAERALKVCGPDLKVFYMVRDPVARAISHHYHEFCTGQLGPDCDAIMRGDPRLTNYGRYAMQIEPWLEAFSPANVRIMKLEDYRANRSEHLDAVCAMLELVSHAGEIDTDKAYNAGDNKPIAKGPMAALGRFPLYRKYLRPYLSTGFKEKVRTLILPKAPPRPPAPREDSVSRILDALADDNAKLGSLMGLDGPAYDFGALRAKHATRAGRAASLPAS